MTSARQRATFTTLMIGALVLEVAVLVWLVSISVSDDEPIDHDRIESSLEGTATCGAVSPMAAPTDAILDTTRRFAIEVPPSWDSESGRQVVILTKKNGRATLSIGYARRGDLTTALEVLRVSLLRSYSNVEVTAAEPFLLDGCPARSVSGKARNSQGVALNFESVVVAGPTDNFVIAGFLERGSEADLDTEVERLIRSVRFYLPNPEDRIP